MGPALDTAFVTSFVMTISDALIPCPAEAPPDKVLAILVNQLLGLIAPGKFAEPLNCGGTGGGGDGGGGGLQEPEPEPDADGSVSVKPASPSAVPTRAVHSKRSATIFISLVSFISPEDGGESNSLILTGRPPQESLKTDLI